MNKQNQTSHHFGATKLAMSAEPAYQRTQLQIAEINRETSEALSDSFWDAEASQSHLQQDGDTMASYGEDSELMAVMDDMLSRKEAMPTPTRMGPKEFNTIHNGAPCVAMQ